MLLVHVVTYNRLPLLQRCCRSIAAALPEGASVLLHFNGAQPEAEAWFRTFGDKRFTSRTSQQRVPTAQLRNEVLANRQWSVVYYLDDDVAVPSHLFRTVLHRLHTDPSVGILGGPQLTPPGSATIQRVQGALLSSPWIAPGVCERYRSDSTELRSADERSLTLCNLAVRCSSLPHHLLLPETVRANEENIWMAESQAAGVKLAYQGDAYVFHERRGSLTAFAKQIFGYGFGRAEHLMHVGRIPMLFCVPAIGLWTLTLLVLVPTLWWLSLPIATAYLALVTLAFRTTRRRESLSARTFPLFVLSALWLHGAYAWGFTNGLLRGSWPSRESPEAATVNALEMTLT